MKRHSFKALFYFSSFFILIFVMLGSFVSADFGVASRYYDGRPLEMYPGEVIDTYFKIQNTIGETRDITVEAILTQGSEIASLVDGETVYEVLAGEQMIVNLRVEIPEETASGTEYSVAVLFKEVSPDVEDGQVQFVVNVERGFQVVVDEVGSSKGEIGEESEGEKGLRFVLFLILGIAIFIVLIVVIWFMLRRGKRELESVQQ